MSVVESLEGRLLFAVSVADLGVSVSQFSQPVMIGGTTYFTGKSADYDWELWKTNGTAAGTTRVADVFAGTAGSNPANLTDVNGTLFFTVSGGGLYKSDGTAAGTTLVKSFNGGGVRALTSLNGRLYFAGYQPNDAASEELWTSDGTAFGTQRVADISPGPYGSSIGTMTAWNGKLYFYADPDTASSVTTGVELFVSDGTAAGTRLLKDINPGSGNSIPTGFVPFNGKLYFSAFNKQSGGELWATDGTSTGTVMVKDLLAGTASSNAFPRLVMNGALYVTSGQSTLPQTLFKIDANSTFSTVKQFSSSNYTAAAYDVVPLGNGKMAFVAYDTDNGTEPWVSDGTATGTKIIKDIAPNNTNKGIASPRLASVNGTAFFAYDDGSGKLQMYATDGTAAGTTLLPTGGAGNYTRYTTLGNAMLFNAGATGDRLFAATVTAPPPPPPPTAGSLSGFTFDDSNKNGVYDTAETKTSGKTVFLDANGNNKLDSGEKSVVTAGGGSWSFGNLAAGTYKVRRVFPSGYVQSNPLIDLTLAAGQVVGGLSIGSKSGTTPPTSNTASISGAAFNDVNRNGVYDSGDTLAPGKTLWLDLDDDGIKDAGEASVVTDANGNFGFKNLAAGKYHVRRVFSSGYVESTPARYVTLTAGQTFSGVLIGSKTK